MNCSCFKNSFLVFILLISINILGQTTIIYPHNRQIFQRNSQNEATIALLGKCNQDLDLIQYKFEPVKKGQGTLIDWTSLNTAPLGGYYQENVLVKGGWYTLKIRTYKNSKLIDSTSLQRVGVGENFIIAGQSNAQGSARDTNLSSGAKDDRVNVANFYNYYTFYNSSTTNKKIGDLSTDFPFTEFSKLDSQATIGPMGLSNYYWPRLGDMLTEKYNVPVSFINAAWLGTKMRNWYESSQTNPKPSQNPFNPDLYYTAGYPFINLKRSVELYGFKNGVRAILWHQGETDSFSFKNDNEETKKAEATKYKNQLIDVIKNLRNQTGIEVPWLVSEISFAAGRVDGVCTSNYWDNNFIQAQREVVTSSDLPQVFSGPNTDNVEIPRKNDEIAACVHFSPAAYEEVANLWSEKINAAITGNSKAIAAKEFPKLSLLCDLNNQTTAKLSSSVFTKIKWFNESKLVDSSFTLNKINSGKYTVRLEDAKGNQYTIPEFQMLTLPQPIKPTIQSTGDTLFCAGKSVELKANGSANMKFTWSTGAQSSNITVNESGTFKVLGTNEFNCKTSFSNAIQTKVFDNPAAPIIAQESPYFLSGKTKTDGDIKYAWEFNGSPLSEITSVLRVKEAGKYSNTAFKKYSNTLTCISPKVEFNYTLPEDFGLTVFPNPASALISIQSKSSLNGAVIKIYTMDGKILMDSNIIQDGTAQINVGQINQGLYKILVKTADGKIYQKNISVYR